MKCQQKKQIKKGSGRKSVISIKFRRRDKRQWYINIFLTTQRDIKSKTWASEKKSYEIEKLEQSLYTRRETNDSMAHFHSNMEQALRKIHQAKKLQIRTYKREIWWQKMNLNAFVKIEPLPESFAKTR